MDESIYKVVVGTDGASPHVWTEERKTPSREAEFESAASDETVPPGLRKGIL